MKQKSECKVYVRMHDGSRLLGYLFLAAGERMQDIMNDERMFIPVHVEGPNRPTVVILSKRYIQRIEEVADDAAQEESEYYRNDRRSEGGGYNKVAIPDVSELEIRGPRFELEDYQHRRGSERERE